MKPSSFFQIGMSSIEVISKFSQHILPGSAILNFVEYKVHTNAEEEKKVDLRDVYERRLHHSNKGNIIIQVTSPMVDEKKIQEIIEKMSSVINRKNNTPDTLAITSALNNSLTGKWKYHFPMIDLKCTPSPSNLKAVETMVKSLGFEGVILESGRSYHFYGFSPLSEKKWRGFMDDLGVFPELVDAAWIRHSKKRGYGVLRISKGGNMRKRIPEVVSIVTVRKIKDLSPSDIRCGIDLKNTPANIVGYTTSISVAGSRCFIGIEWENGKKEADVLAQTCEYEVME